MPSQDSTESMTKITRSNRIPVPGSRGISLVIPLSLAGQGWFAETQQRIKCAVGAERKDFADALRLEPPQSAHVTVAGIITCDTEDVRNEGWCGDIKSTLDRVLSTIAKNVTPFELEFGGEATITNGIQTYAAIEVFSDTVIALARDRDRTINQIRREFIVEMAQQLPRDAPPIKMTDISYTSLARFNAAVPHDSLRKATLVQHQPSFTETARNMVIGQGVTWFFEKYDVVSTYKFTGANTTS